MDCMLELVEIKNDMIRDQLDVIKDQTEEILELKKQFNNLVFLVKYADNEKKKTLLFKNLEYLS